MSSGSPPERRAGDATLERIDGLADGWTAKKPLTAESAPATGEQDDESVDVALDDADQPGDDIATVPIERQDPADLAGDLVPLGERPLGKRAKSAAPSARSKSPSSSPPPPPPGRKKAGSMPPPVPGRAKRDSPLPLPPPEASSAPVPQRLPAQRSGPSSPPPPPPRTKRSRPSSPPPTERDAELEPVAGVIEPTVGVDREQEDQTQLAPPVERREVAEGKPSRRRQIGQSTGSLRLPETLPRRRGPLGDMAYVWTALFGITSARRELKEVTGKLTAEKERRLDALNELARDALASDEIDSATLRLARDAWMAREEQRSARAGAIAAAEEEIAGIERRRDEELQETRKTIAQLRHEIDNMEEKLEPLERKVHAARRKAQRFRDQLAELDQRIVRKESALVDVESRSDEADLEAELAALRAEREDLAGDEPDIAAVIDDLEPLIANLTSSRDDARDRVGELEQGERDAELRASEMIAAVVAKRTVDERAQRDLEREQVTALRQLGERLNVERPGGLGLLLMRVEGHEMAIATLQRRQHELAELVRGVDRWALLRGSAMWLLAFAIATAVAWLVLTYVA